ncbi:MAG: LPS-assembly lipoprotein [Paracoccaceae bacterium]|jgi:LPS-assembly lipoprotein
MWLPDRRGFFLGCAALGGCGFAPAYGPGGSGDRLRGQILVAAPEDREDFTFTKRIEDRLGRNQAALFGLEYKITTRSDGLAITATQETQRYNLVGSVQYSVVDRATAAELTTNTVQTFTSYSATGTTVATRAAERDAYARLTLILADLVITQMIASGVDWLP